MGLAAWAIPQPLLAKKVIGLLLMPTGLVWLSLLALLFWPRLPRGARAWVALITLVYSLAGNVWFGNWLCARLEAPYRPYAEVSEPLDAIYVLGGGTNVSLDGKTQLGTSGERVTIPARLYREGKVKHLIASGRSITEMGTDRDLAAETAIIWRNLDVPDSAISQLPDARNTKEEVHAYKGHLAGRDWKRVGICSSAWHLRRVEKHCQREGIKFIPVPVNFLGENQTWTPIYAIPQAEGFDHVQRVIWELLGTLSPVG